MKHALLCQLYMTGISSPSSRQLQMKQDQKGRTLFYWYMIVKRKNKWKKLWVCLPYVECAFYFLIIVEYISTYYYKDCDQIKPVTTWKIVPKSVIKLCLSVRHMRLPLIYGKSLQIQKASHNFAKWEIKVSFKRSF